MHKECIFARPGQELFIDLIRLENFQTLGQFTLLTHARPDVGIQDVRAFGGLVGRPRKYYI